MEYKLFEFEIHGVDGYTYLKFVIEKDGERIEYDKMLLHENKEDISILQSIDTFVKKKVGDKNDSK